MGPIGRWLVPLFLLVLGTLLILQGLFFLGGVTLIAGVWMSLVRWWRFSSDLLPADPDLELLQSGDPAGGSRE